MTAANEGAPSLPFAALAASAREAKRLETDAKITSERAKGLAFEVRSHSTGLVASFRPCQGNVVVCLHGEGSREDLVKVVRKLVEIGVISAAEVVS